MDYIILDIEFNGRKFASEHPMEVIEIGAVRLDASLQVKDEFSALIKPIYFSTLNSFIKKKPAFPKRISTSPTVSPRSLPPLEPGWIRAVTECCF